MLLSFRPPIRTARAETASARSGLTRFKSPQSDLLDSHLEFIFHELVQTSVFQTEYKQQSAP